MRCSNLLAYWCGGGQLFSAFKIFFIIAEIAIFAGFNLFDFGSVIQELAVVKTYGMGFSFYVSLFRALVYLSLLVGLLIGTAIVLYFPENSSDQALFLICGCGILVLAASVMIPVHVSEESLIKMNASFNNMEDNRQSSDNQNIAEGVSMAGAAGAVLDNATKEDSQREGLPCVGCGLKNQPECTLVKAIQSKSEEGQTASDADEDLDGTGEKQNRTPWRVACKNMVKVYGLSPREEEIFFLIAKGRNAEYVQQKLVISIHTAKTHIANIYRKLDVHSSQEMLTLIEVFRDAPK